jgi:hypothetical protein
MTIKERLNKLINEDNFYVIHKTLGKTQMLKDYDLVRIRLDWVTGQAIKVNDDMIDKFNKEYLDKEILKEEVWSLGCQELALDLFI